MLCGYFKYLLIIGVILFIHDLGHILLIKFLSFKITSIEVLPIGANIDTNINLNAEPYKVFLISIAGVFFQLILYFLFYIFYYNSFITDITYNIFLKYNTFIIIFNLLPIYPLDGLKILNSLLECFFSFNMSLVLSYIVSFISLIIFLIINYLYDLDNYVIIFFVFYKLIFYIKNYKFILNKFYVERYLSDKQYKKVNYINNIYKIRKTHLNFINNEHEKKAIRDVFYYFK